MAYSPSSVSKKPLLNKFFLLIKLTRRTTIEIGELKMNANEYSKPLETARNLSVACIASCRKILGQIEKIKTGLVAEFRGTFGQDSHLVELALNEAEALAWQAGFPQLAFPTLAAEKVESLAVWKKHQDSIRQHGWDQLAA
jgi:hypothetical protein